MEKRAVERLKNDLLNKKSHDIFKNVQALWDLAYATNDMELNYKVRSICAEKSQKYKKDRPEHAEQYRQLYKNTLLFAAPVDFDSFCRYIEWNREPSKRFYLPRRKQLKVVVDALQELADDKLDLLAISMPPGVGKALANDTPVLTRQGWKNHGDLVVGDEVAAPNGEFVRVIAVHPKCDMEYEIEFTNHEKIICHGNHIWTVYNKHKGRIDQVATKDMLNDYEEGTEKVRGHRYMYLLPHKTPLRGEHKELYVDPYTLGAWLGDGSNNNPRICNDFIDSVIVQTIVENGYAMSWGTMHKTTKIHYYEFKGLRQDLQKYGMCHSRRRVEKHIPEEYLTASLEQRLDLLAGLIDTDGSLIKGRNEYQFTTADKQLKDDFITLISTFGWRCSFNEVQPSVSTSGIRGKKVYWNMKFCPTFEIPCRVERKQLKTFSKQRMVSISSIKPITEKVEGNCITVIGGEYCVGQYLVPTHNTTIAIFFLAWMGGRVPNLPMLGGSHSNSFLRGVYDEILRVLDKEGEYLWHDVFPNIEICNTNAKDMRIDLDKSQRFETFEFSSIGSGNAGKVRAGTLLYCDDLVDGIETAMSKERLDKLWQQYTTDLRQRKIGNCKELHIATRWSVHDVIGRLEQQYGDSKRAKFIVIPALDADDNSNFDYGGDIGFSTQFYHEQREIMDDVSWRALYMNQPIEREGLLYAESELRRYFELPDREPDGIISICDTKDKGKDYAFMPVAYIYGKDYYIEDCICDNSLPNIVEPRIVSCLLKNKVQMARFESNNAGGRIAKDIQEIVKKAGGTTKITTKFTTSNKETKIILQSAFAKEHFLFKDNSLYKKKDDYGKMIDFLCSYTVTGKNKHDDVPDGMAMLSEYAQSLAGNKVQVFQRPF